jgi:uncharacterized protein (DUF736 family)
MRADAPPAFSITIKVAIGGLETNRNQEITMTTIGTFTPAKDGFLQGKIKTLTLNLAKVTLEPVNSDQESAPAFRLFAIGIELGAAWAKTAKESGRRYYQVRGVVTGS